jgi:hypothetical protein
MLVLLCYIEEGKFKKLLSQKKINGAGSKLALPFS